LEAGAAENRVMLNGMNSFNLGTRAANHAGITHAQMLAADNTDGTIYKAALVELLVAADRSSAEKKMNIDLIRRKGDIATAQKMDHHHNADHKERQAYKDMMKSARAEFVGKWVPGAGKGHGGLPKESSGLPAHITEQPDREADSHRSRRTRRKP
jgi:phage-related tail fiber protein